MKPCRHADAVAGCRLCELARTHAGYAKLWGEPEPAMGATRPRRAKAARTRGRCVHLGPPVPGPRRVELKLSHAKDWRECGKGHGTGGIVCPCGTCKTCPDHAADADQGE